MGRLYSWFALFLQALIIATGLFLYIGMHPETTRLLGEKILKPAGIGFERIDGSLPFGIDIYGVTYQKALTIGHLGIHYKPIELILPTPIIRNITVENIHVWPKRFESGSKNSSIPIPALRIMHSRIAEGVIYTPDRIEVEADAKETILSLRNFSIDTFSLNIKSPWGTGRIAGTLKNRAIDATGYASAADRYLHEATRFISPIPKKIPLKLHATEQKLSIFTKMDRKFSLKDANTTIANPNIEFVWHIAPNYFTAKADYEVESPFAEASMKQSLLFTPSLAYATKLEGELRHTAHPLPFKKFMADAAGSLDVVTADIYAGPFTIGLYSRDYNHLAIQASAKPHTLAYIEKLPKLFSSEAISLDANATVRLKPELKAKGTVVVDGNFSIVKSTFEISKNSLLAHSLVSPKDTKGGIWANIPPPLAVALETIVYLSPQEHLFALDASNIMQLTLFEKMGNIHGWGNIDCLNFDANGTLHPDGTTDIDFLTKIESVHELMEDLNITSSVMIDAEVHSRFGIHLADTFSLRYETKIPWYLIEPDPHTVIYGTDSVLIGGITGKDIRIDRYHLCIIDHCFDESRASHFHLDENLTLHIDSLALLDHATAKGYFSLLQNRGEIHLGGKDVHYSGPEGNISANLDIKGAFCAKKVDIEGEVEVLDALITYKPKTEYTVNDEDIVIIQDIKEPSHTEKIVDLHIYSTHPLRYKTDMVDAYFIPDITIWKEAFKPLTILGLVKVTEGSIDVSDKHFTIESSDIYFRGAHPINPYLELHILYSVDLKKFHIYISHTLADPVFFFSSEPPMSQNDIMSYILFGAPANEAFSQSQQTQNGIGMMLLGAGLKKTIGSATGIKFDTLNILSTQEGGFGIEIGKRIGKRLRIIYRNDTVSSFIIQYTASRSIQIDVEIYDTGQGVKVLYIKDIRSIP